MANCPVQCIPLPAFWYYMNAKSHAQVSEPPYTEEHMIGGRAYRIIAPAQADRRFSQLPVTLKILAENVARHSPAGLSAFGDWLAGGGSTDREIEFRPARVLMHDTTCVPALVDLATLRDASQQLGGHPAEINPAIPVDLVIDHSVMVDYFGSASALALNLEREFERNAERYAFIKWAERSLANFRVVPPGTGIIHQINLEHLSQVIRVDSSVQPNLLYPDTLVGTDSHTPMINALGIVAWGVGGIEGLAAALGHPLMLKLPEVVGVHLTGSLRPGVTATDLALTLTRILRERDVVEKIVEFCGAGVAALSVADRATIANMAPEYGATCSYFPIDQRTLAYLRLVGRSAHQVAVVEGYARAAGLWLEISSSALYSSELWLDLDTVETTVAGPRRPEDSVRLGGVPESFRRIAPELAPGWQTIRAVAVPGRDFILKDGAVLIAAITSCTNTSNPALMIGAALLARKARTAGLTVPSWVKTSLSPGSEVVTDYLRAAGLQDEFDALGFQTVGYGCMTCIGNSGSLDPAITALTDSQAIVGTAVLSGNRNFQGRINPAVNAAYLASPALVVAYALAGTVLTDLRSEPLGTNAAGAPVYLHELWPSDEEIAAVVDRVVTPSAFRARAAGIFVGPPQWQALRGDQSVTFAWDPASTYLRPQPYFENFSSQLPGAREIRYARTLAVLGDNITTDHISPAGIIPIGSLAGQYLAACGVAPAEFNQYSTRRGNHEVMLRGVLTNPRLRNELLGPELLGGLTRLPNGEVLTVFAAAGVYRRSATPLLIFAGHAYGAGSSRDWAAKGPALLGVRAVIAESFERIHRSNLIGMGVLPLQFTGGLTRRSLALDGTETFDLRGLETGFTTRQTVTLVVRRTDGSEQIVPLLLRVETELETEYLEHGGLLPHLLRRSLSQPA